MAEKKIICDTDVMIDYWDESNVRHKETKLILENEIGLDNVVLTAITKIELLAGAINKKEIDKIDRKLNRFNITLLNNHITIKAFELMLNYRCSHGLALPDCFIAATVMIFDLQFFTYNKKDFKFIAAIKFYNS